LNLATGKREVTDRVQDGKLVKEFTYDDDEVAPGGTGSG
jgi:hypothetical protein